jgi:hypothetical protein
MAEKQCARLRIIREVHEDLVAAAKEEKRDPSVMLNVLLAWALEQRDLLGFDIAKLFKVHLSIDEAFQGESLDEPWNYVVSGKLSGGDDGDWLFERLRVR